MAERATTGNRKHTTQGGPSGDAEEPGPGLRLFPPGASPDHRRRRLVFLTVYALVAAALLWPIYPRFAAVKPLILGLPLSLAWVILDLAVIFVALLWLYRTEPQDEEVV